jgi:hypothetical protein
MLESGYAAYEDTETCLRIKRLGYDVVYTPHAIVQHGLEPREGGFTRDFGLSPRLAYSVSRNSVYTLFKTYRLIPRLILGAGVLGPMTNVVRTLLPRGLGKSGRSLSLSGTRWRAAAAIVAGHFAGLACVIRSRNANLLPRLNPPKRRTP